MAIHCADALPMQEGRFMPFLRELQENLQTGLAMIEGQLDAHSQTIEDAPLSRKSLQNREQPSNCLIHAISAEDTPSAPTISPKNKPLPPVGGPPNLNVNEESTPTPGTDLPSLTKAPSAYTRLPKDNSCLNHILEKRSSTYVFDTLDPDKASSSEAHCGKDHVLTLGTLLYDKSHIIQELLRKLVQSQYWYRSDRLRFVDAQGTIFRIEDASAEDVFLLHRKGQDNRYKPYLVNDSTPPMSRTNLATVGIDDHATFPLTLNWVWLSKDDLCSWNWWQSIKGQMWFYYQGFIANVRLKRACLRIVTLVECLENEVNVFKEEHSQAQDWIASDERCDDLDTKQNMLENLDRKAIHMLVSLDSFMNAPIAYSPSSYVRVNDLMRIAGVPFDDMAEKFVKDRDEALNEEDDETKKQSIIDLLGRTVAYLQILGQYTKTAIDRNDDLIFKTLIVLMNLASVIAEYGLRHIYPPPWKEQIASVYKLLCGSNGDSCGTSG